MQLFFRLAGQRVGEVAGMRRSELDLKANVWRIPAARSKNGHAHDVPLTAMAIEIIAEAGQGDYFFPNAEGAGPLPAHAVAKTITRAQKPDKDRPHGRFGIADWTAHDLRRTVVTGMAKLGVAPIVLGHVINHRSVTKAGVTLSVYSQHTYEAEKRHALDLWADRLAAIVGEKPAAAVVPMARSRA